MKFLHYLRWTLGLLVLAVLLLFALSNGQPVELSLFPTGLSTTLPLSVVVLAALAFGFLAGGLVAWLAGMRHRRAAKRAEAALRDIQAKSQSVAPR